MSIFSYEDEIDVLDRAISTKFQVLFTLQYKNRKYETLISKGIVSMLLKKRYYMFKQDELLRKIQERVK